MGGENVITDLFLAVAGCEVIMKISLLIFSRELKEQTFNKIRKIILNNLELKIDWSFLNLVN